MPKNMLNNYRLLQVSRPVFLEKFGTFVAKIDSGLQKKNWSPKAPGSSRQLVRWD
jgi:hypothetical protein